MIRINKTTFFFSILLPLLLIFPLFIFRDFLGRITYPFFGAIKSEPPRAIRIYARYCVITFFRIIFSYFEYLLERDMPRPNIIPSASRIRLLLETLHAFLSRKKKPYIKIKRYPVTYNITRSSRSISFFNLL